MRALWSAGLGLAALLITAMQMSATPEPKGVFNFQSVDLTEMLDFYRNLTGLELVIPPSVAQTRAKITLESNGPRSRDEAAQMIERALIEQAGIVITRLGNRRASVAVGERLELEALRRQAQLNSQTVSPEYEVRGEVSWIGRDGKYVDGGKRTSGFTVCVKGYQWSVSVFPSNWPPRIRFDEKDPVPILSTMTSDGTYGYDFRRYNSNETRVTQVADRWLSTFPAGKGSTRELYPLWYAFASHNYCRGITNENILPLEPGIVSMNGTLKTNAVFPHLPVFGLALPAEAVASYTALFQSSEPWSTVVLKVQEVRPRCAMTSFVPDLNNEPTSIFDWTYNDGNPPHEACIKTNRWPTAAEVNAFYFK